MNYATIKENDIANGEGVRVSLFVSGCRNCCDGCFNKEAWDFNYGREFTYDTLTHLMELCDRPYIQGLSILGGEPLDPKNIETVDTIVRAFRLKFGRAKDLWIYTGYTFEDDDLGWMNAFNLADIVVDGRFEKDKKDPSLWFKGSSNQRIIDVHKTQESNKVVEWIPKGVSE